MDICESLLLAPMNNNVYSTVDRGIKQYFSDILALLIVIFKTVSIDLALQLAQYVQTSIC